jgi:tRNA (guanine-N7-)-methyltransferase
MKGKKLFRFAAIEGFENVFQYPENIADKWPTIFNNSNEIILELACGKGEYAVNLAKAMPNKNFVGIDVKGNRMYVGAKKALEEKVKNVAFLRTQIQKIEEYFPKQSIEEIWITFPDPFLKDSKSKNRLTHSRFLKEYQKVLKPGALINLKTDSKSLFDFTLEMIALHNCEVVKRMDDVYINGTPDFPLNIQTFYEGMHLEDKRTIQYICFRLPATEIIVPPKKKKPNEEETTI